MEIADLDIKLVEKQMVLLWRNLERMNCLRVMEEEANYLMKGFSTEMIDSIQLPTLYEKNAKAKLFGVVGAEQSKSRYVWIYVYHRYRLWKCYNLKDAYSLIEKLEKHNEIEFKIKKMKKKQDAQQKLLSVCEN